MLILGYPLSEVYFSKATLKLLENQEIYKHMEFAIKQLNNFTLETGHLRTSQTFFSPKNII